MYFVKEIFYTIQGEGANSGRPAVFCRFSGCNLWSGYEKDRSKAVCQFCDTDFVGTDGLGGGKFATANELAIAIFSHWPDRSGVRPFVVCTGGEPLLQMDDDLIKSLHRLDFEIAIETNGTRPIPEGIDWICVSPKAKADTIVHKGNELKLIYPQVGIGPESLLSWDFEYFYLQPMDGPDLAVNTKMAIDYCLRNPKWNLSFQTHKFAGIR